MMFLEIRASDDDIEEYLHCRISKERRLARHVESDGNLQDAIIEVIVNNAQGMFLLAQLHLDSLAKKHNKRDVRLALHSLPKELNGTYDEAMHRIYSQPTEDVALAKRVLSWISCAKRTLTVLEIQHALAVEPEAMNIDEEALIEEDLLVSVCVGLVTIEEESSMIRLVHFTTQEYLQRTRIEHFPTAEIDIALSCLTYLLLDGYAVSLFSLDKDRELRDQYPLLQYVAIHWAAHTRGGPEENTHVQRLALQLLENKHTVTVLHRLEEFGRGWLPHGSSNDIFGLPVAASSNLITITTLLLDRGARVEDAYDETALHYAADRGHGAIVKLLLERGAQIDATTVQMETALVLAAASGHELVMQMLLECGADVNIRNDDNRTPLGYAVSFNSSTMVGVLLEASADINSGEGYTDHTALFDPVFDGNSDTVQLLLDAGIDIHKTNKYGETALFQGTDRDNGYTTRLLLDAGADVNARDRNGMTALFTVAARADTAAAVQLLLKEGADMNIKDNAGRTALFAAAGNDEVAAVRLLLKEGADMNTKDNDGRTVLFAAAGRGAVVVVQLLLKEGADVNTKDSYGKTALFEAAVRGRAAVVRFLLKEGADVNTRENNGKTVLHAVVCENWYVTTRRDDPDDCYDPVVQSLLEAGVNFDARDGLGTTALRSATERGYTGAVQLLLHAGAEFDARDGRGRTALHIAVKNGQTGALQSLLNAGAELDARDDLGRTALHVAAKGRWKSTSAVQLLLNAGADYELKAHDGRDAQIIRTPLEIAVSKQHWDVVKLLEKAKKRRERERKSLGTNWDWTETGDLVLPIQTEVAPGV